MTFEAVDLIVNAIEQRFDQPSFDSYARMESLLVKALISQDNSKELRFMEIVYGDGVDMEMLTARMGILKVLLKGGDFLCFDIIVKIIVAYPRTNQSSYEQLVNVKDLFLAKRGRRPRVAGFIILSLKGLRRDEISCGVSVIFIYLFICEVGVCRK